MEIHPPNDKGKRTALRKHNRRAGQRVSNASFALIAVLFLTSCNPGITLEAQSEQNNTPKESFVEAKGSTFHVKQWSPQGPPALFLSGGREGMGTWKDVIPSFTDDYKIFTMSERKQDRKQEKDYLTWREAAGRMAHLIDHIFKEPVIILGHSYGAHIAATIAADHPQLVRAIVLEDIPCDMSVLFPWLKKQLKIREIPYDERITFYIEKGKTAEEAKRAADNVEAMDPVGFQRMFEGKVVHDIRELLPRIKCAAFFMFGNQKKGSISQEEYRLEFRRQLPHAKFSVWPETGHHLHGPDPKKFVKEIKAFLQKIGP